MKVEDAFDIAIDDAEAEKTLTPRQLIELVMSKVGRTDRAACLTQRAFHRLRAALMRRFGMKRSQIRTETPLAEIFPQKTRRLRLRGILNDLSIPKNVELLRPSWLNWAMGIGTIGSGAAAAFFCARHTRASAYFIVNFFTATPILAGIITAFCCAGICMKLTKRLQYEFGPNMGTVAGFSRWIVAHNPNLVQAPPGQWSREQVAEIVREIVIEVLGCEKQYREDAHFVKDLGMG